MGRQRKLQFVMFLTFARFPLVLLFFVGAIVYTVPAYRVPWLFFATFASLVLSALTDLFDGYYARKFHVTTSFGAHADPLMDKFFYLASLPLLVFVSARQGEFSQATALLVLTLLFLARDQWVTFLRSIGAIFDVSGKANWSGKLRTAVNFPMICVVYYYQEHPDFAPCFPGWAVWTFVALALVITIISLFVYTRNYWPYLCKAASVENTEDDLFPEV